MRFHKITPAIAASAFAAVLAVSAPAQAKDSDKEETEQVDPDKKVCKRQEVIGTRIKKRRCMTQAQWDLLERRSQEEGRSLQDRGLVDPSRPTG